MASYRDVPVAPEDENVSGVPASSDVVVGGSGPYVTPTTVRERPLVPYIVPERTSGLSYRVMAPEGVSMDEVRRRAQEQVLSGQASVVDNPDDAQQAPAGGPRPDLSTGQRMVRQAAPSIVGGHLLGVAGGALAGPPGLVAGEMVGSGLGELANQTILSPWTGAEWSPVDIGLAALAPGGLRAAGKGMSALGKSGLFASEGRQVIRKFTDNAGAVNSLINGLEAGTKGSMQAAEGLGSALRALAPEERTALDSALTQLQQPYFLKNMESTLKPGQFVRFNDLLSRLSTVDETLRPLIARGGPESPAATKLYLAAIDDLEKAGANLAGADGAKVRALAEAVKQRGAADLLSDLAEGAYKGAKGADLKTAVGVAQAINNQREVFERLLGKPAVDEMMNVLTNPAVSGRWGAIAQQLLQYAGPVGRMGGLEMANQAAHGILGVGLPTGMGAALGALSPAATAPLRALGDALATPAGRKMIQQLAGTRTMGQVVKPLVAPVPLAQAGRTLVGPLTPGTTPRLPALQSGVQLNPRNLMGPAIVAPPAVQQFGANLTKR